MCGILCQDHWVAAIRPLSRPPAKGGWVINTLPPSLASNEHLVWAWETRKRYGNNDAAAAVNEMVSLLQLNDVVITPELKKEIREHADREWCQRDPTRCKRKPAAHDPSKMVSVMMRAPHAVPTAGRRCCGG